MEFSFVVRERQERDRVRDKRKYFFHPYPKHSPVSESMREKREE